MIRSFLCEMLGTFFLVFAGTGAIIANESYGGTLSAVGVALSFGLVVMAVIYAIGDTSGAHINPAVSIAFWVMKRLTLTQTIGYIISQCIGAILASSLLKSIFSTHPTLGLTQPSIAPLGAFVYEYLLSFLLMMVILSVATGAKEKGLLAAIAIGGTVSCEALFAGPITGASMNPARSLGPALLSGNFSNLWIYLIATPLGTISAIPTCRTLHPINCCQQTHDSQGIDRTVTLR